MVTAEKGAKNKGRPGGTPRAKKDRLAAKETHVGEALRSIYQQTIDEQVPDEFLKILGKLA